VTVTARCITLNIAIGAVDTNYTLIRANLCYTLLLLLLLFDLTSCSRAAVV